MEKALLFYDGEPILVSAEEVLVGKYLRDSEFVDAEYPDYKVRFICAGKPAQGAEIGIPYFRLYYSYKEYKELYPDRADKYKIVADMRKFQESPWHREWKEKLSSFCETEKYFKFENRWKYADAFYTDTDTCIELQHSYSGSEFEDRNEFYSALKKKIVWLFHLPKAQVREAKDGTLEILEDNARGFFRAAYETQNKFDNVSVFIQTKSQKIYRVTELYRRNGNFAQHIATVRFFKPNGVWTEEEWIEDLRTGRIEGCKVKEQYEKYDPLMNNLEQIQFPSSSDDPPEVENKEKRYDEKQTEIIKSDEVDYINQEGLETQISFEEVKVLSDDEIKRQAELKEQTEALCLELGVYNVELLSKEEAWYLPKRLFRKTEPWWLSSKGYFNGEILAAFKSGSLLSENVNTIKGIRPVLRLREDEEDPYCEGQTFDLAGHTFSVINDHSALCDDLIGYSVFRNNRNALDSNEYSNSDVKKFIDEWCKENYIKFAD